MKWRKLAVVTGLAVGTFVFANESNASANSVNDYIFSKNWAQNDTQNHIQWWLNHRSDADMNYRHKKPEGVIVHETANSSDKWSNNAIWNEINYMLGHSDSAFVHSFVDEKRDQLVTRDLFKPNRCRLKVRILLRMSYTI